MVRTRQTSAQRVSLGTTLMSSS